MKYRWWRAQWWFRRHVLRRKPVPIDPRFIPDILAAESFTPFILNRLRSPMPPLPTIGPGDVYHIPRLGRISPEE